MSGSNVGADVGGKTDYCSPILEFDGTRHRTAKVNETIQIIFLINNNLKDKKRDKHGFITFVPRSDPAGPFRAS